MLSNFWNTYKSEFNPPIENWRKRVIRQPTFGLKDEFDTVSPLDTKAYEDVYNFLSHIMLQDGELTFIHSAGGSGKSHMVETLIAFLWAVGREPCIITPTGVSTQAYKFTQAKTIFSEFKYSFGPKVIPETMKNGKIDYSLDAFEKNDLSAIKNYEFRRVIDMDVLGRFCKTDNYFIDEISMVGIRLLSRLHATATRMVYELLACNCNFFKKEKLMLYRKDISINKILFSTWQNYRKKHMYNYIITNQKNIPYETICEAYVKNVTANMTDIHKRLLDRYELIHGPIENLPAEFVASLFEFTPIPVGKKTQMMNCIFKGCSNMNYWSVHTLYELYGGDTTAEFYTLTLTDFLKDKLPGIEFVNGEWYMNSSENHYNNLNFLFDYMPFFGGKNITFVGDMCQLLPINDLPFGYLGERMLSHIRYIELRKNMRFRKGECSQLNKELFDALSAIRITRKDRGLKEQAQLFLQNLQTNRVTQEDAPMRLLPRNAEADFCNSHEYALLGSNSKWNLFQESILYALDEYCEYKEGDTIEKVSASPTRFTVLNPAFKNNDKNILKTLTGIAPESIKVRPGTRIMITKNIRDVVCTDQDYPNVRLMNGQLGLITEISVKNGFIQHIKVYIDRYRREYYLPKVRTIELDSNCKYWCARTQYPIMFGWAISIHKSQSCTVDSIRVDVGKKIFCDGQTYVALSRCSNPMKIFIDDLDLTKIYASNDAVDFMYYAANSFDNLLNSYWYDTLARIPPVFTGSGELNAIMYSVVYPMSRDSLYDLIGTDIVNKKLIKYF